MMNLRNFGFVIIIIGALASLGIMFSAADPIEGLEHLLIVLGFYVWVALPFVVLFVLTFFIHRDGFISREGLPRARVAIFLTTISVVVLSVLIYWFESSSPLMFAVMPFWSLVMIGVVYGLSWLVLGLFMAKSKT
jgi:hypothetical protein